MLLQTLATLGPLHGYAIAARLEQVSGGVLRVNMGTLYPGLMRLEQRGLVRAEWNLTDTNRKARFYAVTAAGRRQLAGVTMLSGLRSATASRSRSDRGRVSCCPNEAIS
jgi:PadR family transcriptional regulator PadR